MRLHRGQKVLCVNDRFKSYCSYPLKKGMVYSIHDCYTCGCGSDQVTLVEKPYLSNMKCGCGRLSERRQSYYIWRFIPLEYFEEFISLPDTKDIPEELTAGVAKNLQDLKVDLNTRNLQHLKANPGTRILNEAVAQIDQMTVQKTVFTNNNIKHEYTQ